MKLCPSKKKNNLYIVKVSTNKLIDTNMHKLIDTNMHTTPEIIIITPNVFSIEAFALINGMDSIFHNLCCSNQK